MKSTDANKLFVKWKELSVCCVIFSQTLYAATAPTLSLWLTCISINLYFKFLNNLFKEAAFILFCLQNRNDNFSYK